LQSTSPVFVWCIDAGLWGRGTITDAMLNLIICEQFTKIQGNSSGA
jgi:hypothetical protein